MSIATWPSDLPAPEIGGYGQTRQNARRSRTAQNGPPRYGRRLSAVPEFVGMQVTLDAEELGIFDQFFAETLSDGSLPFWMTDYFRDGRPLLDEDGGQILDDDDLPILVTVSRLCLWGSEPPQMQARSHQHVRVSFSVSFLP